MARFIVWYWVDTDNTYPLLTKRKVGSMATLPPPILEVEWADFVSSMLVMITMISMKTPDYDPCPPLHEK